MATRTAARFGIPRRACDRGGKRSHRGRGVNVLSLSLDKYVESKATIIWDRAMTFRVKGALGEWRRDNSILGTRVLVKREKVMEKGAQEMGKT